MSAWSLHLENVALRKQLRDVRRKLTRERTITEMWRHRAMNGRAPGRATRKTT